MSAQGREGASYAPIDLDAFADAVGDYRLAQPEVELMSDETSENQPSPREPPSDRSMSRSIRSWRRWMASVSRCRRSSPHSRNWSRAIAPETRASQDR